ncbi:MAG: helix-turn-helix domain-containing protein [Pseudomonadota bacterium]|nr:helix-turn-helix domain-containing protein [Pseudomonadota bacterium]
MNAQVQIIERNGKPEYAVVPIDRYRRLLELAENAEDIRAADHAMREIESGEDEVVPVEVTRLLLSSDVHPLRVWREFRNMTQENLAYKAKVGKSYISQIEAGKKPGSVSVLTRIARVLNVDIDDLVL